MLPLQQAKEVRQSVIDYIKATFRFKEQAVGDAFYRFIEDRGNGMFKGPYISLKTPFIAASDEEKANIPLEISPSFPPYKHQLKAFSQLSMANGHAPEPTLLTTGTGSGKTECFLYPILDYCYHCNKFERKRGVKVIILYPMNALASDQARRLAKTIWDDERLRGRVTAGLFVGEGVDAKEYPSTMDEYHIIENRKAIIDTVPDILLTNFKMLDYGLMRQNFMELWKGNIDAEDKQLRFIVLDELHTYDGAQGTDVANLIRRLKLKLHLPKHFLCPIGTSATIGNGGDSKRRLCEYASDVFGESFHEENVIGEERLPAEDYIHPAQTDIPTATLLKDCVFQSSDNVSSYMRRICKTWVKKSGATPFEVATALQNMSVVQDILVSLSKGMLTLDQLRNEMVERNAAIRRMLLTSGERFCDIAIENLLTLIAYAKQPKGNGGEAPMLYLQVQLWQRELSGILRYVQTIPEFTWRNSLRDDDRVALPMYFCRECGASGWISRRLQTDDRYSSDITTINKAFMDKEKEVVLLNIESKKHEAIDDYLNDDTLNITVYSHMKDLTDAGRNDADAIRLRVCRKWTSTKKGNPRFARFCPECNSDTICQIGGKTSTLSSVAISQVLSSDFDKAYASERKILTFTNSVQDAAHQAGFYEARTFRFLFRQSMQKYINTLDGKPISMADLQKGFKVFWKEQLSEDDYYNRFLPADLATHIDLRKNYRQGTSFMQRFKDEFDLRVDWEICSEFGLMAQLGRTLEKTGLSATFFQSEDIKQVFEQMKPWLLENHLEYVAEDRNKFCHFVYGILQRMRMHGAVDHPYLEKYRNEKLTAWALNWNYDSRHFLNRSFGGTVRFPKLVGTQIIARNYDMLDIAVLRQDGKHNWYSLFFDKTYNRALVENYTLFNELIVKLFDTMEQCGIVNKAPMGGGNFAINPQTIWVSSHVKHIQCDSCQSWLCVAEEDEFAEETSCLDYKCRGTYSQMLTLGQNYYRQVYNREISPRVYAREHTGLLERKDREELEHDFKEHPHSNSVNALSATSTLEMGIDIGDLNVVGNTSVPPKPSNFLQRVGRAGRKEGSALVLNYAHAGKPHDMYYFTYPTEMMEGEVNTPGCFLEAKDILRRHFFAYCIDTWTSADVNNTLPASIGEINLSADLLSSEHFIINRIIAFIKANKRTLIENFRSQYDEKVHSSLDRLVASLDDESFYQMILKEFRLLTDQIYSLLTEQKEYKEQEKHLQPNDPTREIIKDYIKASKKQYVLLQEENLIEYLTNVGLLPNYAFPETGIKLQANVYSSREKEDSMANAVEPKALELVRSASQGIKELAPGNKFYTQKLKLDVSGISTFDWKDTLHTLRYCSKCDCIAEKGTTAYSEGACPKCGDPSWGVNSHHYLKFTNARCMMRKDDASLDDSNEDREQERYIMKKHFMFHHNGASISYAMRNVGFGIEFCNSMDLYEANYGMAMQSGNKQEIAGDNAVSNYGFVTCKYCGKSIPLLSATTRDGKAVEQHYKFCNHKDITFAGDVHEEVFEKLYLYRHMQTEAIKILLPIQIMDAQASIEMFKAGIALGMKSYYHSSPEHLRIDSYSEFNHATQKKDHYLVIYDTIPGGTGYLAKLFNTEEFTKLLKEAYEKISECQCQYEGKSACYHCILSYGNQYSREEFSRERAEELFKKLIDHTKSWETINGSVGTIASTGVVEDSELEIKFSRALQSVARQKGWTFEKVHDINNYRYELHIINEETDTDILYHVHPQFALGSPYGVKHYTISDFQVICVSAKINGESIEDSQRIPQWAVYLDGYDYHAQMPNMRFFGDIEKRDGIRASRTHLMFTWILTWDDIKMFESDEEDFFGGNSLTRFISLLQNPKLGVIRDMIYQTVCDCEPFMPIGTSLYQGELNIDNSCDANLPEDYTDEELAEALDKGIQYNWHIYNQLTSIDKEEWEGFWRRYDLLQFFSNEKHSDSSSKSEVYVDRDEVKVYYPGLEHIVDLLLDNNIPFSYEGDVDVLDEEGIVVASAGLLIPDKHIAIDPIDNASAAKLQQLGYKTIDNQNFNINEIK